DLHVVDADNKPVSGGLVWTYVAGTSTLIATYTDIGLTTPNTNPIVADSGGRFVAMLAPGQSYKFVYEAAPVPPATHGAVLCTRDNIATQMLTSTGGTPATLGANTFSGRQDLSYANPTIGFNDTLQPANLRKFRIWNTSQQLVFDAVNDTESSTLG